MSRTISDCRRCDGTGWVEAQDDAGLVWASRCTCRQAATGDASIPRVPREPFDYKLAQLGSDR